MRVGVTRAALGVRILPGMLRAALFTFVGVVLCVRSLQSFADPEYMDPESASDWFAVLSFSTALFALALALPMLAQMIGGRVVFRVSLVAAVGAALAGLANLFEDALHWAGPPGSSGWAFWLFITGTATTAVGLTALAVCGCRGRSRPSPTPCSRSCGDVDRVDAVRIRRRRSHPGRVARGSCDGSRSAGAHGCAGRAHVALAWIQA